MLFQLIFPVLGSAIVTTIGLILIRPLLLRNAMDAPNHRSSHVVPTPRGGGVGVLLGVLAGLVAASSQFPHTHVLVLLALVPTLFAVLGFVDDLVSLPVAIRLSSQVALCVGVGVAVRTATRGDLPGFRGLLIAIGVGLIGIFYVNAANFMDGVNGISGLHGFVVGGYFCLVGLSASSSALLACGAVVSIAFAAFLPWNIARGGLFLGDVGSYLLGASIWLLASGAVLLGMNVIVAFAPLTVYSLDVAATLARRTASRAKLTAPHREHTYQQIQQLTGSHAAAALACTGATLICVLIGWLIVEGLPQVIGGLLLVGVGFVYLALPPVLRHRPVGKTLLLRRH